MTTEKIFPTARAVPGHRRRIVLTLLWPVTGLIDGTPVLIRQLMAPHHARRAEAAELQARQAELSAQAAKDADEAFRKKLAEADPAKRPGMIQAREAAEVAARQVELELAKAARKESRSKFGDTAGAAVLVLIIGGPLVYSLVGPWIAHGIGLAIGGWWIAALIHAPKATKVKDKGKDDEDQGDEGEEEGGDDQEEESSHPQPPAAPAKPLELSAAELTTTVEHMVALRARTDEGRGHVHLAEALESLQRHGHYPDLTARDFGALVRAAGLPTEPNIRVPGRTPSTGFTAASLHAHLRRSPTLPPQAAAQAAIDHTPQAV
ncbi:hypothetical protein ACGF0D_42675 [Kitasatospora sp. NPDC048298]|uniref:hypothetical protein n=1 Tax=Kitasatospora sp. NPDC048298 TaxID=3364049 RepID=UPI003720520A